MRSFLLLSLLFLLAVLFLLEAEAHAFSKSAASATPRPLYIGFDLGTSGCRISVLEDDAEKSNRYSEVFTKSISWQENGCGSYDDPKAWMAAVTLLLQQASTACLINDSVSSISFSGTSASCLLIDKRTGHATRAPRMYNYDVSAGAGKIHGLRALESLRNFSPPRHTTTSPTSSLAKLLAWNEEQRLSHEVLCHQADYLVAQFRHVRHCGASQHFQIHSDWHNCLKLGYDVQALQWPAWMDTCLQSVGLDSSVLPSRVVSPGEVLGPIHPERAKEFGLPERCVVVGGTTDSNAALIAGLNNDWKLGSAVTSLGSTLALKQVSSSYVEDASVGVYSHRVPSVFVSDKNYAWWLVGGASNVGCAVLRAKGFSNDELDELCSNSTRDTEDSIATVDSPLNYYPLVQRGERFPVADSNKEPILEPKPSSRRDYLFAILQGISTVERDGYKVLGQLGAQPSRPTTVYTSGGGSRNDLWTRMRQRRLNEAFSVNANDKEIQVLRAQHVEASYGAALLAASTFQQQH